MDVNYPLPLYYSCGLNYHFAFSGKCGKICRQRSKAQIAYGTLYDIDYGFVRHQPLNYMFTYVSEILHAIFIITCTIMGDLLLLCFCLQLCMHFDFLSRLLENYEPDALAEAKYQLFIGDFVKKYQILLNSK